MGKITGFLEFERSDRDYEPVEERIKVARIRPPAAGRGEQEAGGTLHGLSIGSEMASMRLKSRTSLWMRSISAEWMMRPSKTRDS
jgi:hypothetical protein